MRLFSNYLYGMWEQGKFYILKNGEPVQFNHPNGWNRARRLLKNPKYGWGEAEWLDYNNEGENEEHFFLGGTMKNPNFNIVREASFEEIVETFGDKLDIPVTRH